MDRLDQRQIRPTWSNLGQNSEVGHAIPRTMGSPKMRSLHFRFAVNSKRRVQFTGRGLTLYVIAHRCRCRRMRDRYCFIKRTLQFTTMDKDWWGILVEVCQRGSSQPLLLSQRPILPLATSAHLDLSIVTLYTSSKLADVVDAVPNRSWPRTVRNRKRKRERKRGDYHGESSSRRTSGYSLDYISAGDLADSHETDERKARNCVVVDGIVFQPRTFASLIDRRN